MGENAFIIINAILNYVILKHPNVKDANKVNLVPIIYNVIMVLHVGHRYFGLFTLNAYLLQTLDQNVNQNMIVKQEIFVGN